MQNLCFEIDPEKIADILNGEENVDHDDLLRAVIGLARIVSLQQKQIATMLQYFENKK